MKDKITENINDLTNLLDLEVNSNNTKTNQIDTELKKAILECWENRPDSFNYVDIDPLYNSFNAKFGKDKIANFTPNECLYNLFGNAEHDSLVYNLEKKREYLYFAKVGGWKTIYALWKKIEDGNWYCRLSGNVTKQITEQEAEKIAAGFRDSFVSLFEYIENLENNNGIKTEEDYINIDTKSKEVLGILYDRNWVKKYLHMVFPDIFTTFFSDNWVNFNFNALKIKPKATYLLQCYQFSTVAKSLGIRNAYLSQILSTLFDFKDSQELNDVEDGEENYEYIMNTCLKPEQVIYYGAPGTGKSDTVEKIINKEYPGQNNKENYVVRVVFHPDYTYSDFVGCIKPVRKEKLDYEFVAGPFLELLKNAILDAQHKYYLVLEEINRGNAAAIFGDIFQLLDRDINGKSVYSIKNTEMAKWLSKDKRLVSLYNTGEIWLPNNFNILCTMNTADQNVFVLDSAFKRRFNMEYIQINFDNLTDEMKKETAIFSGTKQLNEIFKGSLIENFILKLEEENKLERNWETFALIVNKIIDNVNEQSGSEQISEDKKLGPFFVTLSDLKNRKVFVNKVLYYLKEDVFKYVDQYFVESYEELYNRYLKDNSDLFEMLNNK